ncbi:iron-sulfur cluster assembly accessory protein [Rhodomicrobium vannielii ATCC 17100]|uniref:Iron-sulfur cluster assembly accessory protein n=1 Tax=Rhodomicrobium vannielii (strain ATCC 17100 / DSM 162 / LMG 4299 / NCIMB 10020 / ATH 3.1.1) TaxID=648757 RepID=E3I1D5_RHOVT|nr:iron-sulfur cluster assembly accessory protein [Rhodomicrobium vannielii]ADP71226.1 iron-sulfur cluster assembly accessory protein [Rhodomicrobium vannielii ATCC 17100]
MIYLTEAAANAVRTAIKGANTPIEGLRLAVDAGGCAGFKYLMGLVADPNPEDIVVEERGVKVFVDRDSVQMLEGTTVDFVIGLQSSGFTFDNPQATASCSCGKSFG